MKHLAIATLPKESTKAEEVCTITKPSKETSHKLTANDSSVPGVETGTPQCPFVDIDWHWENQQQKSLNSETEASCCRGCNTKVFRPQEASYGFR